MVCLGEFVFRSFEKYGPWNHHLISSHQFKPWLKCVLPKSLKTSSLSFPKAHTLILSGRAQFTCSDDPSSYLKLTQSLCVYWRVSPFSWWLQSFAHSPCLHLDSIHKEYNKSWYGEHLRQLNRPRPAYSHIRITDRNHFGEVAISLSTIRFFRLSVKYMHPLLFAPITCFHGSGVYVLNPLFWITKLSQTNVYDRKLYGKKIPQEEDETWIYGLQICRSAAP